MNLVRRRPSGLRAFLSRRPARIRLSFAFTPVALVPGAVGAFTRERLGANVSADPWRGDFRHRRECRPEERFLGRRRGIRFDKLALYRRLRGIRRRSLANDREKAGRAFAHLGGGGSRLRGDGVADAFRPCKGGRRANRRRLWRSRYVGGYALQFARLRVWRSSRSFTVTMQNMYEILAAIGSST
jgi:hypothetical protein